MFDYIAITMKKYITLLLAFASLNSFAQRAPSACSEAALSGAWQHAVQGAGVPMDNLMLLDFTNTVNPLVMNLVQYGAADGRVSFIYKSLYSTAQLDAKTCVLKAHLTQTQSLDINENHQVDGTSDYNDADQVHYIKIQMLSDKKMKWTNCATDASCAHAKSEVYKKQ